MKLDYYLAKNTWLRGDAHGWGNGYVVIPEGHELHGLTYDKIDIEVHGGLTYSEKASFNIPTYYKDCWVIGFDTCHCDDNMKNWTMEDVKKETEILLDRVTNKNYEIVEWWT